MARPVTRPIVLGKDRPQPKLLPPRLLREMQRHPEDLKAWIDSLVIAQLHADDGGPPM